MDNTLAACDSKASVATTTRNTGKSSHVAALRSLGLLHDLQEYVASLQQTTVEQEKELSKLKGEKQEAERVLKKELRGPEKQPYLQHFQASEIADLPPRLRALFEDNKVLKEEIRRYKGRAKDAERLTAQQEQQLASLQEQVRKLKHQIAEGAASPEALAVEEQARQQADVATRALTKLQEAHKILQQKLESDTRSHKQALIAAAKERHQLEQQIQELQQQLDAKDKEARASTLAAKKAERRLHEVKVTAAEAVSGVNAAVAKAVAAEQARQKQIEDASVHLMLCIIKEPICSGTGRQQHRQQQQQVNDMNAGGSDTRSQQQTTSATAADADAIAGSSRSGLMYSRDEAVVVLQAGARGYLTRKRLKVQQQYNEQTAVVIQAGTRSNEVRQRQRELAEEEQQQQQQKQLEVLTAEAAHMNDKATASSITAERLRQAPAVTAVATSADDATGLPMDLPPLPTVAESAGRTDAAAALVSRASSSVKHRASSMGGASGPRMRTSAPQFNKSVSQPPRAPRQAGSASPRLTNNSSNKNASSRRSSTVAVEKGSKGPSSGAIVVQQQQQGEQRASRPSLQQQVAAPGNG